MTECRRTIRIRGGHEGRHYKKLTPVVAVHRCLLDEVLEDFWDYYRALLADREAPNLAVAQTLRAQSDELFSAVSGDEQLAERKRLTAA
jgi:hypothetical protein